METIRKIKLAHGRDEKSIGQIARDFNLSRNTVRKVLRSDATKFEYHRRVQPMPRMDGFTEWIAEQLELSGRHLNRKLADEGTSFKLLREQVLHHMAEQLLRDSARLGEVAERLGFSDESAFAKAFRRWSARAPLPLRRQ